MTRKTGNRDVAVGAANFKKHRTLTSERGSTLKRVQSISSKKPAPLGGESINAPSSDKYDFEISIEE